MLTRALIATALLVLPAAASAATPKHRHHAARVTTATYRTPMVAHRAAPDLRASAHGHKHAVRTRYAAGRHHTLIRGS